MSYRKLDASVAIIVALFFFAFRVQDYGWEWQAIIVVASSHSKKDLHYLELSILVSWDYLCLFSPKYDIFLFGVSVKVLLQGDASVQYHK